LSFLHYKVNTGVNSVIEITLDKQANVRLMDGRNLSRYKLKKPYEFTGGLAKVSPMVIRPPHKGDWHVIVDLEGFGGTVKATVQVKET